MTVPVDARLQRLLGGDGLVSLRKRLRQRFERQSLEGGVERFRISNLSVEEHAALASLLGQSARFAKSIEVDLQTIDNALQQAGITKSLREALEQLDGPIIHIETARRELQAAWSRVVSATGDQNLAKFLQTPEGIGVLKRLSGSDPEGAARLCCSVETVLRALPAKGVTRAQLAARTLGDAHALDGGQAAATIVLAVWRNVIAPVRDIEDTLPDSEDGGNIRNIRDERNRDVWARAGVLVNELARPAMFLNLHHLGNAGSASIPGEPGYASLRFLVRSAPRWNVTGRDVFICENPNLLAIAADELGRSCAPMVCTDGMPSAAQRLLLTQLAKAGAQLRYHGDFDWPGLRIGNHVVREYGALPWRFSAADYAAAIEGAPRPGRPLRGPEVDASWDIALSAAMRTHQLTIAEESVAASLLQDLRAA